MADLRFSGITLEAYLSAAWYNMTEDRLVDDTGVEWGINGVDSLAILPDIGEFSFTLLNVDGKYYPDGLVPLSGWGYGVKVRLTLTYSTYTRTFIYYVSNIELQAGITKNEDRVRVTALDWIKFAESEPILALDIELNKRADEGINILLSDFPVPPASVELQTGNNTFPVIFNDIGLRTTAITEFARLVKSEFGALALLAGEKLKFFNYNHLSAGEVTTHLVVGTDSVDAIAPKYGNNVINRATVKAYPKKVDTELSVLYTIDRPMLVRGPVTFRAQYSDPNGGTRANAIPSSMQTPEAPGAVDPYLMTLMNFTEGFEDETGRHTWTNHDPGAGQIFNDIYGDSAGTHIAGNILGRYMVFGGYADGRITTPTSDDFEFGAPSAENAFTIGWFQSLINPAQGNITMARDNSINPPFLLGVPYQRKEMLAYFTSNGTSWDIGNARSFGQIQVSRWVWYEASRDEDGWYYLSADGKITDRWYSSLAIKSSTGDFTVGNTLVNNYAFMGFDSFFIKKGQCLHKTDFEPPRKNMKPTLDGDYLLNSLENGTGRDLSADLDITASYGSEAVTYELEYTHPPSKNVRPFATRLQARGRGVYAYNPIENSVEDAVSMAKEWGVKEIVLDQKYQTNVAFGTQVITKIVAQNKDPHTRLESLSFWANTTAVNMVNFMTRDIGDLIHVTDTSRGIDNFYFIQKIKFRLQGGGLAHVTWNLKPAPEMDTLYPPPVPPTYGGAADLQGNVQLQDMGVMELEQTYSNETEITLDGMDQLQDMGTMGLQQVWLSTNDGGVTRKILETQFDLTDDDITTEITELSITLTAGSYIFRGVFQTSSNIAAGAVIGLYGTATASLFLATGFMVDANSGVFLNAQSNAIDNAVIGYTAVQNALIEINGSIIVTSDGTLIPTFAQNFTNVIASSVLVGSNFVVERIS